LLRKQRKTLWGYFLPHPVERRPSASAWLAAAKQYGYTAAMLLYLRLAVYA